MQRNEAPGELAWEHAIRVIPQSGLAIERAALAGELTAIARALDLIACVRLTAEYTITPIGRGRYRLAGRLRAEVEQACVVTLESIGSTIEECLDVDFWPAEDIPAPASGEVDIDEDFDPEPIREGRIGVGRVICACLAAAIDPFPRKPGAVLERHATVSAAEAGDGGHSPFAVLARIRSRGGARG
jgi:hypothetical protein